MARQYGPQIMAAAWRVGQALLDAATNGGDNPYIKQADLKAIAGYKSNNAMDDVMTCLALHAPEIETGAALFRNKIHGYRLVDNMDEQLDIAEHIRNIKIVITKTQRLVIEAAADGNDDMLQRWSRKLDHMIEDELVPYLESLDIACSSEAQQPEP